MRIVHLIPTLTKGGAERFVLDVAIAQQQRPHTDVLLLVMGPENQYADYSHLANVRFIDSTYLPSMRGKGVLKIEGYREAVSGFQPDVIHTHLFRAELLSSTWIYPSALYVTHCHDNMIEFRRLSLGDLSKRAITNYYERLILLRKKYSKVSPYFIANSDDTLEYFKKVLPKRLAARVQLIPYGFRFSRFFNRERSVRTRPRQRLVLTMVGSFIDRKKNQEFLVDVAFNLKQRGVEFEMNLIGDGPRRPAIEHYAKARNMSPDIRFWGLVTNVEEILWDSDVYVHSATYEPFGLVFLEAMAAGLPAVALDGRGNRRLIRNGVTGFLLPTQDPAAFCDRILDVTSRPDSYAAMSKNAIELAAEYDIGKCADALLAFYRTRLHERTSAV